MATLFQYFASLDLVIQREIQFVKDRIPTHLTVDQCDQDRSKDTILCLRIATKANSFYMKLRYFLDTVEGKKVLRIDILTSDELQKHREVKVKQDLKRDHVTSHMELEEYLEKRIPNIMPLYHR